MLGKPELVAKGHFDDVDMAMMIHTGSRDGAGSRAFIAKSSNGALVKRIRFVGRAAHAGSLPQLGVNALNAAMIAMNAISAQRETFWEKDTIRIHPIITKGGDAVSVVPAEVTMETFVRGGSLEAIVDANKKVDRCLCAGAMAMGAEVEIHTIPGYLPQRNDERLGQIFGANVEAIFGPGQFHIGGHRTGSTDMGDLAHLMPVIHPYIVAAEGKAHGADWRINEPEHGLFDAGQAAGDDRHRPAPWGRRFGAGNSGAIQPGDDQESLPGVSARPLSDRAFHLHRGMMDADRNSIEARGCVMLYSSVTARGTICYAAALHFCCVPKKNPGLTGMAARAAS